MDTAALPTTTTSAEPLYISNEPLPAASTDVPKPKFVPVDPVLPGAVQLDTKRTATCEQKKCWRSSVVPRTGLTELAPTAPHPDLGIVPPVAVWQEKLKADVTLEFPRVKSMGLLGVVLDGVVTVSASEGGKLAAMKTWGAFVAPGVGLKLTTQSEGSAVLLVAYGLVGGVSEQVEAVRKSDKAVYWEQRPGTFVVDDLERTKPHTWAGGAAHAWLGFEADRSPNAYLGALLLGADVPVAEHDHDATWEVLVPIRAKGALVLSGDSLPNGVAPRIDVRPGEVILMPANVRHRFEPGGQEPLLAIQLFVPPGPEQRFKKLAAEAGLPVDTSR